MHKSKSSQNNESTYSITTQSLEWNGNGGTFLGFTATSLLYFDNYLLPLILFFVNLYSALWNKTFPILKIL